MSETSAAAVAARRVAPNRFFAVPNHARRDRRPTDVALLVTAVVVVAVFATRVAGPVSRFERALTDLVAALPSVLDPVFSIANDALRAWAVVLVLIAAWHVDQATAFAAALTVRMVTYYTPPKAGC
ncbi:MAG: hypothetical protein WEB78_07225 [Ilumatobacteraceae bacterium]